MRALAFVALLGLAGCKTASPDPILAAGESLHIAADQFVGCAELMDRAMAEGLVTKDTYGAWVDFAVRFKPAYQVAYTAWQSAVKLKDASKMDDAQALLSTLLDELDIWFKMLIKLSNRPDGGTTLKENL